jgi:hypothetical protein
MGLRNWRRKSQDRDHWRGQGSSWTVAPLGEEEEEEITSLINAFLRTPIENRTIACWFSITRPPYFSLYPL